MGQGANMELIRAAQLISVMVGVRNQIQSVSLARLVTSPLIRELSERREIQALQYKDNL